MGDRAIIVFHNHARTAYSSQIYLQYAGSGVKDFLDRTRESMGTGKDDPKETAARFISLYSEEDKGGSPPHVDALPKVSDKPKFWEKLSPGDAGVFVVDALTWDVRTYGGYGLNPREPEEDDDAAANIPLPKPHKAYSSKSASLTGYTIGGVIALLFFLPALMNLWLMATGEGYRIPPGSNFLQFHPTVMNTGSGDWWVYGEDKVSYYYATGNEAQPYLSYDKARAAGCQGFNPHDQATWCP